MNGERTRPPPLYLVGEDWPQRAPLSSWYDQPRKQHSHPPGRSEAARRSASQPAGGVSVCLSCPVSSVETDVDDTVPVGRLRRPLQTWGQSGPRGVRDLGSGDRVGRGALADPAAGFRGGGGTWARGPNLGYPQNSKLHGFNPLFLGCTQIHFRKKKIGSFWGPKDMMTPSCALGGMVCLAPGSASAEGRQRPGDRAGRGASETRAQSGPRGVRDLGTERAEGRQRPGDRADRGASGSWAQSGPRGFRDLGTERAEGCQRPGDRAGRGRHIPGDGAGRETSDTWGQSGPRVVRYLGMERAEGRQRRRRHRMESRRHSQRLCRRLAAARSRHRTLHNRAAGVEGDSERNGPTQKQWSLDEGSVATRKKRK